MKIEDEIKWQRYSCELNVIHMRRSICADAQVRSLRQNGGLI